MKPQTPTYHKIISIVLLILSLLISITLGEGNLWLSSSYLQNTHSNDVPISSQ